MCLLMTDSMFLGGHPASIRGLQSHLDHLSAGKRVEWTSMNYGGNLFPRVAATIAQGGHVSVGPGEHPYNEFGMPTIADLIHRVVAIARDCGRAVATPAEAWQILNPSRE